MLVVANSLKIPCIASIRAKMKVGKNKRERSVNLLMESHEPCAWHPDTETIRLVVSLTRMLCAFT